MTKFQRVLDEATWCAYAGVGAVAYAGVAIGLIGVFAILWVEDKFRKVG